MGYARGNNLGIRIARGAYLLLVNNDVLFDGNAIEYCLRRYQQTPRAILGRKLIRRRGPWNSLNGRPVRCLEGWCLFASAAICRELGFWRDSTFTGVFDETFSPAFFEDIDLSLRASLKQIALRQVAIPVRHLGSRTTRITPRQEKTLLPQGRPAHQAPNRAQNLRSYFTGDGVRVVAQTTDLPPWQGAAHAGSGAATGTGRRGPAACARATSVAALTYAPTASSRGGRRPDDPRPGVQRRKS